MHSISTKQYLEDQVTAQKRADLEEGEGWKGLPCLLCEYGQRLLQETWRPEQLRVPWRKTEGMDASGLGEGPEPLAGGAKNQHLPAWDVSSISFATHVCGSLEAFSLPLTTEDPLKSREADISVNVFLRRGHLELYACFGK